MAKEVNFNQSKSKQNNEETVSTIYSTTPDEFVTEQMDQQNMKTAVAITTDKDKNINFAFNGKDSDHESGMTLIAQSLAAFIESNSKSNPMFRHEFLKALGQLNGVETFEAEQTLEPNTLIKKPHQMQEFINRVMKYIETELTPTAAVLMLTNADPSMVAQDPSQTIPFTYHIVGDTSLMAYGMHGLRNQLNGTAYQRHLPHAMSPKDNDGKNAEAMRLFTNTLEDLNEMDKRVDHMDDKAKK